MMRTNIFSLHVILCSQENSTWQIPETNADTREAHTHATAVQRRRSESCLTLAEVKRVRCPVYLLFLLSGSMHTTGSLSHRTQASTLPPPEPPVSFFTPCPAPITAPLSWSATWVMTTPGTLSPRCHFCHRISCWLRPCIPCLLFSAHVLTVNCLENRKGIEAAVEKKKKRK